VVRGLPGKAGRRTPLRKPRERIGSDKGDPPAGLEDAGDLENTGKVSETGGNRKGALVLAATSAVHWSGRSEFASGKRNAAAGNISGALAACMITNKKMRVGV